MSPLQQFCRSCATSTPSPKFSTQLEVGFFSAWSMGLLPPLKRYCKQKPGSLSLTAVLAINMPGTCREVSLRQASMSLRVPLHHRWLRGPRLHPSRPHQRQPAAGAKPGASPRQWKFQCAGLSWLTRRMFPALFLTLTSTSNWHKRKHAESPVSFCSTQ